MLGTVCSFDSQSINQSLFESGKSPYTQTHIRMQ